MRRTHGRQLVGIVGRSKWRDVSEVQNEINHLVRQSFMFHYRGWGGLRAVFAAAEVAICCRLLQTVAPYLLTVKRLQTVHKLLQFVAKCQNLQMDPSARNR
jgi:hypothetical protein